MSGKFSGYFQIMRLPPPVIKATLYETFFIVLYFRKVHDPRLGLETVPVARSIGSGNIAIFRIRGRMAKFLTVGGPRRHLFLKVYAMESPPPPFTNPPHHHATVLTGEVKQDSLLSILH